MAIVISNPNRKKSQISPENKNKRMIGLKLPLERGKDVDGYFNSTTFNLSCIVYGKILKNLIFL